MSSLKPDFDFNYKNFLLFIFFLLFFLLLYKYSTDSLIVYFRLYFIGFFLLLYIYKSLQYILKIYDIIFNIYIFEFIYLFIFKCVKLIDWFNRASEVMEKKYIPTKLKKNKDIIHYNKYLRFLFVIFIIVYLICNMFFYKYQLTYYWAPPIFLSCGFYLFFVAYLEFKYLLPNLHEFFKTDILFQPDGTGFEFSPKVKRMTFTTGRYLSPMAKFCYLCIIATLGLNWTHEMFYPDRRTPAAALGKHLKNNFPWLKKQLDYYSPVIEKK